MHLYLILQNSATSNDVFLDLKCVPLFYGQEMHVKALWQELSQIKSTLNVAEYRLKMTAIIEIKIVLFAVIGDSYYFSSDSETEYNLH